MSFARILIGVGMMMVEAVACHGQMTLDLRVPPTAIVGEAVPLRLAFTRRSSEPAYVEFSGADYGTESLVLCAYREERWYQTGQIHFDRDHSSGRFDFVPLHTDQTFESPILSINDPGAGALPILRLPESGTYEIFAIYTSSGSMSLGVLRPIWRGMLTTPVQKLTLKAPSKDSVDSRLVTLRACASEVDGCDPEVIGYFQVVRDSAAAELLVAMLDNATVPDPVLAEAVANQRGIFAKEALKRFAMKFPSHADFVARLYDADGTSFCASRAERH